jgi:hypothetical protein
VQELSQFMAHASLAHLKEAMKYCFGTPNRGLLLKPMMKWDKDSNFEFKITGRSYSDFTKDPEGHQSVSGYSTFLCGASVNNHESYARKCDTRRDVSRGLNVRKKCYSIYARTRVNGIKG